MTTQIDGLKIHYRDEGVGPLLVLLHGWGANVELFDQIFKLASGKYRVIGPDFPGCGGSDEPQEPMDLDDYVTFVRHFLAEVAPGEHQATFLGHSHGGRVLIHLAAGQAGAYPCGDGSGGSRGADADGNAAELSAVRLILVDSAGIVPVRTEAQKKKTARYRRYKAILTGTGIAKLFPGALDALQKKFGSADYAAASPVMRQTMVRVVNADLTAEMPGIKAPTLLIWGEADTDTPLSDGKRMEELIPGAGLAVIPGVGHFSFLENPYHFGRILGSFLEIGS